MIHQFGEFFRKFKYPHEVSYIEPEGYSMGKEDINGMPNCEVNYKCLSCGKSWAVTYFTYRYVRDSVFWSCILCESSNVISFIVGDFFILWWDILKYPAPPR